MNDRKRPFHPAHALAVMATIAATMAGCKAKTQEEPTATGSATVISRSVVPAASSACPKTKQCCDAMGQSLGGGELKACTAAASSADERTCQAYLDNMSASAAKLNAAPPDPRGGRKVVFPPACLTK